MTLPKTILITGATSGFGAALARLCAAKIDGVNLILTGRRAERLDALKAELNCDVHTLVQDITDTEQVYEDIKGLPAPFNEVDCLINNAGAALGVAPFQEADQADIDGMINTNIRGLTHMTRAVLPGMIERKRGYIINIGSVAGTYAYPGGNVYCGTKSFVNHFSKVLRADLKGKNVRVTSVEPGAVETEFSVVRYEGDQDKAAALYKTHRSLTADHIANTLFWLISQPEEMNVNQIEIMPTDQSFAGFDYTDAA